METTWEAHNLPQWVKSARIVAYPAQSRAMLLVDTVHGPTMTAAPTVKRAKAIFTQHWGGTASKRVQWVQK